jgi:uncharacterized membrane protein YeaQ/YmgE (transglycosylase-associated protein family)
MGILISLIVGGLAGWLASIILNRNSSLGIIGNIVVGLIGAFIGNLVLAPIFGFTTDLANPTFGSFLLTVGGAVILLAIVNLFTRKSIR